MVQRKIVQPNTDGCSIIDVNKFFIFTTQRFYLQVATQNLQLECDKVDDHVKKACVEIGIARFQLPRPTGFVLIEISCEADENSKNLAAFSKELERQPVEIVCKSSIVCCVCCSLLS
jgi:hypothetical protein